MFAELRDAFRQAVENFKKELDRDRVPEEVDRLVSGMRDEVADAKAYLARLEKEIEKTLDRAEAEKEEVKTCRRREEMAREIGDEETATVAAQFAEKHEKRRSVLERKALALEEELDLRRSEVEEMMERIKKARARRADLGTRAGRASARDTLGEADDLFAELDRMAEKISDEERRSRAADDLAWNMEGDGATPEADPEAEPDARLEELKRRMGKE